MALFIPELGAFGLATELLAYLNTSSEIHVGLYSNNVTPDWSTVLGDLTEPTFTGYARIAVADWAIIGTVSSLRQKIQSAADKVWTVTGGTGLPQNIYGYFITSATYDLLWAEKDSHAPIAVTTIGQVITVRPNIEVGNC